MELAPLPALELACMIKQLELFGVYHRSSVSDAQITKNYNKKIELNRGSHHQIFININS